MLIVPRINVRDAPYNAKGDGVTDDTAAIVAALAATPTGAACFFPRGVYLLDADAIVNYTARWIVGELIAAQDNSATTIRARTEGTALFHAINSFGVANIRFDADDKADHALSIENGISTILTNCIFEGGLDAGLLAEDLSGAVLTRCIGRLNGGPGYRFLGGNAKTLIGCAGVDNGGHGLELLGQLADPDALQAGHTLVLNGDFSRNGSDTDAAMINVRGATCGAILGAYIEAGYQGSPRDGVRIEGCHNWEIAYTRVTGALRPKAAYRIVGSTATVLHCCHATGVGNPSTDGRIAYDGPTPLITIAHDASGSVRSTCTRTSNLDLGGLLVEAESWPPEQLNRSATRS